jgi:hypothetical protein
LPACQTAAQGLRCNAASCFFKAAMSYDLRLCLREDGRSPEEVATREADEVPAPNAEEQHRALHLAAILSAAFPQFTRTEVSDMPGESTHGSFRPLEFTSPEGGTGLQITIYPREAGLSLPYHAHPDNGRAALAEMWRCAQILEHEGGFFTYDSQLGKVLDLAKDFENALTTFAYGRKQLLQAIAALPPSKRPLPLFPHELDRLPYLLRWLGLQAAALALMYGIFLATRSSPAEPLILVPAVAWLVVKILVIDPARLRAIGWSPALTFVSLFPPAGLFLQLLLFFLSSRLRQTGRSPSRTQRDARKA